MIINALRNRSSASAGYSVHFRAIGQSLPISTETPSMMSVWDAHHAAEQRLDRLATAAQEGQTVDFAPQFRAMLSASLSF